MIYANNQFIAAILIFHPKHIWNEKSNIKWKFGYNFNVCTVQRVQRAQLDPPL